MLALLVERVGGASRSTSWSVGGCANLRASGPRSFLRSDELPANAATGYLSNDSDRTNVLHLPVRGSGDGGVFTTIADVSALWTAFLDGRIVSQARVAEMLRPRRGASGDSLEYGLGFWLHPTTRRLELHGYDAGVSFRSVHDQGSRLTWTVVSNSTEGSFPIETVLERLEL